MWRRVKTSVGSWMPALRSRDMPTRQALMISTVAKRDYGSAIALNSGIFNFARGTIRQDFRTGIWRCSPRPRGRQRRLLSFYSFVLVGGMPVGALLASLGVSTIGARLTVLVGALTFGIVSASMLTIWKQQFRLATHR